MTVLLECDGCRKPIDPAKEPHLRADLVRFDAGDPPVSTGALILHFHGEPCIRKYKPANPESERRK